MINSIMIPVQAGVLVSQRTVRRCELEITQTRVALRDHPRPSRLRSDDHEIYEPWIWIACAHLPLPASVHSVHRRVLVEYSYASLCLQSRWGEAGDAEDG